MDTRAIHVWKFFRAGGFDQVRLETGADLKALEHLDQKLWVALACPTRGVEFDPKTLDFIDTDKDGRIRAPEIMAAVEWATTHLKDPDRLLAGEDILPLAEINSATPQGKQLLNSAREILATLGKPEAAHISLDDTADTARIFSQTRFNGDGIVPPETADDDDTRQIIADIMETVGAATDRSGRGGVDQDRVDLFFAQLEAHAQWWEKAEGDGTVMPLGERTADAYAAFAAVRARVDDYFARCRLASFDQRAASALNRTPEEYAARGQETLSANGAEFSDFPLARIEAGKPLPLGAGANPAWMDALAALRLHAVEPLLGAPHTTLADEEWQLVKSRLLPYETWQGEKGAVQVEKLGLPRIRAILAGAGKARISTLIEQDRALEPEMNAIATVDKLLRYHRDLYRLLNNFVSFRDFYHPQSKAIFQAGTLYIDGRQCELCVRVADPAKHAALASLAKTYLAYLDCTRCGSDESMTIVAAITNGDGDQLMVGRNGVFYDRDGGDWDATIVKLVEHSISIREAFWMPYKRVGRMVSEQIEKFASAKDKALVDKSGAGLQGVADRPAAPPAPFDAAKFAGVMAAAGLALGALGTALASVMTGFLNLAWWQMPLVIIGAALLISGPSMIITALKLRHRNLGPILDANGWAVNARVKINIPFGASLTKMARLPHGSRRSLADPYRPRSRAGWWWALLAALVLAGVWWYVNAAAP